MRLERVSLAIVAVVALVILAVPFWRGLALSQFRQTRPGRASSIWTGRIDPSIPSPEPKTDAQMLREHPNDFLLRLALAEERIQPSIGWDKSSKRAKQAIQALILDFPTQPAAYELALNMPEYERVEVPQRMEGYDIRPEEAVKYWHDPGPPTKEQLDGCQRCIEIVDKAIAADPQNGWFHFVKAYYLYGLRRDTDAFREIHIAATAPHFADCARTRYKAWDHLFDLRGGFDPLETAHSKFSVHFPFLASARVTARTTAHLAYKRIRQGRTDEGVRMALDVADSGYKTAKEASVMTQAMAGVSLTVIGTAAFDPAFACNDDDARVRIAAFALHRRQYLAKHGYTREAAALRERSRQYDRLIYGVRTRMRSDYLSMDTLRRFPLAFINASAVLAVLVVVALLWLVSSLFSAKRRLRAHWDRRAGATSAFLCSLIFAPIIVDFVRSLEEEGLRQDLSGGTWFPREPIHVDPKFLIIPAAVMALALVTGLVVMLRRIPKDGQNRAMPAATLLVAYLVAFAGLMYLHCEMGVRGIPSDYGIEEHAPRLSYVQVVFAPAFLLVLYALLRAVQSRFGRVRQSAPLTFVATLRYGSAVAVALIAVAYLCLMPLVAHLGMRADDYARYGFDREAAVIQSAFK